MRKYILAIGAVFLAFAATAKAADYPTEPVQLIVPFAPGGSVDTVARILGEAMTKSLGQSLVVENRAGAGGNIGFAAVATAKPDGYTLLMASSPLAVNISLYDNPGFDPAKDFAPISLVALQPQVLVVNPELKIDSVEQLIAYAKANPGKLNFGSAGPGASQHLAGEMFKRMAGVDMVHVPYRGGGPAMTDLVAGRIQLMFETIPSSMGYVKSNQLKPLAVTVAKRSSVLPDVPTIAEAGTPGYSVSGWLALAAPAGTPDAIVAKLSDVVTKALAEPAIKGRLTELGLEVVGNSPKEFGEFLTKEIADYKKLIADANIKLN